MAQLIHALFKPEDAAIRSNRYVQAIFLGYIHDHLAVQILPLDGMDITPRFERALLLPLP